LKIATRTDDSFSIDLVVTMPKSLFQDKDYLNHRYFYKRAYYLACLAAGINESKEHGFKLSYDYLSGNQLQPYLVVAPVARGMRMTSRAQDAGLESWSLYQRMSSHRKSCFPAQTVYDRKAPKTKRRTGHSIRRLSTTAQYGQTQTSLHISSCCTRQPQKLTISGMHAFLVAYG
jgi:hypothetical protein